MEISGALIMDLRKRTGSSMSACKSALVESGGDINAAIELLRKQGIASASKKSSRATADGVVTARVLRDEMNNAFVVIGAVSTETDFVAKSERFTNEVDKIFSFSHCADSVETLNKVIMPDGSDVQSTIANLISVVGENVVLKRFEKIKIDTKSSYGIYIHNSIAPNIGKIAAVILLDSDRKVDGLDLMAKQLAMHIAAAKPTCIDVKEIPEELIAKEKEIFREQCASSGKSPDIIEKMVNGRITKFYSEVALLEQVFILDNKTLVKDVIASFAKSNNCNVNVKLFRRFEFDESF